MPEEFRDLLHIRDEHRSDMGSTRGSNMPTPRCRARTFGISERVFADGNVDWRVASANVDIPARHLRDANVDPVAICLRDACVDGGGAEPARESEPDSGGTSPGMTENVLNRYFFEIRL